MTIVDINELRKKKAISGLCDDADELTGLLNKLTDRHGAEVVENNVEVVEAPEEFRDLANNHEMVLREINKWDHNERAADIFFIIKEYIGVDDDSD